MRRFGNLALLALALGSPLALAAPKQETNSLGKGPKIETPRLTGSARGQGLGSGVAVSADGDFVAALNLVTGSSSPTQGGSFAVWAKEHTGPATPKDFVRTPLQYQPRTASQSMLSAIDMDAAADTIAAAGLYLDGATVKKVAYVYSKQRRQPRETITDTKWALTQTLEVEEGGPAESLSLALSGDGRILAVGNPATGEDYGVDEQGVVLVWRRQTGAPDAAFEQAAELKALDGRPQNRFGSSVALGLRNAILVGAPNGPDPSAYLFRQGSAGGVSSLSGGGNPNAWFQMLKLASPYGISSQFGACVAMPSRSVNGARRLLLVGAPANNKAYVYEAWSSNQQVYSRLVATLKPTDEEGGWEYGGFGAACAIGADARQLIVGAPESTKDGDERGAAFFFRNNSLPFRDYGWQVYAPVYPATGAAARRAGFAVDISTGPTTVLAVGVPGDSTDGAIEGSVTVWDFDRVFV